MFRLGTQRVIVRGSVVSGMATALGMGDVSVVRTVERIGDDE